MQERSVDTIRPRPGLDSNDPVVAWYAVMDCLAHLALRRGNGFAITVHVASVGRPMFFSRCTPEFNWRRP